MGALSEKVSGLDRRVSELKTDLEKRISDLKGDLKWGVGIILTATVVAVGVTGLIVKVLE